MEVKFYLTDVDDTEVLWRGASQPTQAEIDWLATSINAQGWNGTQFDLYHNGEWIGFVSPSEGVLT